MRYSMIAAPLALAAGANAWDNGTVYTTEVVTAFTTYCPYATQFTHGTSTYTVTEATLLTITNCPCTVTKPVLGTSVPAVSFTPSAVPVVSTSAVAIPSSAAPVTSAAPIPSAIPSSVIPPFPVSSSVVVVISSSAPAPVGTATSAPSASSVPVSPVAPSPSPFTGAGNRVAASSAGLAALLGLAAYLL